MAYTFTKPSTGETFVSHSRDAVAAEREFLAARKQIDEAARTDGKRINSAHVAWSTTDGLWECVETNLAGRVVSTLRCTISSKWYTPSPAETETARIDTLMDGGREGSMGMIGR